MINVAYNNSDRDKRCRLCEGIIQKKTLCLVMENVHVPPKKVDLFFHEECLTKALKDAADKLKP